MTQKPAILKYLKSGRVLTPINSFRMKGINSMRLAARILELRADGHMIHMEKLPVNGKLVGHYSYLGGPING